MLSAADPRRTLPSGRGTTTIWISTESTKRHLPENLEALCLALHDSVRAVDEIGLRGANQGLGAPSQCCGAPCRQISPSDSREPAVGKGNQRD